jgi:hypothetical protein
MRISHRPYVWRSGLGYVADFCPICREPRAFRLCGKRLVPQSFYIPVGFGELVGNERRCLDCGVDLPGDPTRYTALSKKPASFGQLRKLTYPSFDDAQRGRLELEKAVRDNPSAIGARDRQRLIRQPLELLSPRVEAHTPQTDRDVAITVVAAWAAVWAGTSLATRFSPDNADAVLLGLLAVAVLAVVVQLALVNRRYMRREIAPLLVRCLAPLKPRRAEIEAAVADMKAARHKIGSKLSVDHLMQRLEAARA